MDLWSIDGGSICLGYMCIVLYVKLIWCSGVAWIYDQLTGGPSAIGIFAFFYMWNLFGVVVLHGSMIDWWGVHLPWVYVHCAICETYLVWWCCMDLWLIDGGSICLGYMCIHLYVKLILCSGVACIYDRLIGGPSAIGIFAFFYMWNLFGVVVLHGSMIDWGGSICLRYGVVVLHGSMIDWWGVHLPWVYLHSSICETYSA